MNLSDLPPELRAEALARCGEATWIERAPDTLLMDVGPGPTLLSLSQGASCRLGALGLTVWQALEQPCTVGGLQWQVQRAGLGLTELQPLLDEWLDAGLLMTGAQALA